MSQTNLPTEIILLTPKEYDILEALSIGKTRLEIIEDLGISSKTLSSHLGNIILKMQAKNTIQALAFYIILSNRNQIQIGSKLKISETERQLVLKMHSEKHTYSDINKRTGVSLTSIYNILNKHGLTSNHKEKD